MGYAAADVISLDKQAQKDGMPRPHGYGGSAEGDIEFGPNVKVVSVKTRGAGRPTAVSAGKKRGLLRLRRVKIK
jgi:hypothetical protein